ncbi:MAG: hypothetical protein WC352_06760, partial [Candidatus Omnitrophota bacterium]
MLMSMSDYHRDSKPISLRLTSVCVLVAFMVTQLDVRLATASPAPTPIPTAALPAAPGGLDKEDVHYMKDVQEDWDNPLSPATKEVTREEAARKAAEQQAAPVPKTVFGQIENPLAHPEGEAVTQEYLEDEKKLTRYAYENGTSYSVDQENGRLHEIVDFTRWNPQSQEYEREKRSFSYSANETGDVLLRISTERPGGIDEYQVFATSASGNPTDLLETGLLIEETLIKQTEYDRIAQRMTVYDPMNAYSRTVYELSREGEAGRLLEYQDRLEDGDVSISLLYDDREKTKTVINRIQNTFEVYELVEDGRSGRLMRLGNLRFEDGSVNFEVRFDVEIVDRKQMGSTLQVYSFRDARNPERILERRMTENGAVGELVRVKDDTQDLEYVYEADEKTDNQILTILNYRQGTFLKFERKKRDATDWDGTIQEEDKLVAAGKILQGVTNPLKALLVRKGDFFEVRDEDEIVRLYEVQVKNQIGRVIEERGPPTDDPSKQVYRTYAYDDVAGTRTIFDHVSKTYSVNQTNASGESITIQQGTFEAAADGTILRQTVSQDFGAAKQPSYIYAEIETRTFEYGYELIRQGIPSAVFVDSVSAEDLQRLSELPFEVGIAIVQGRTVLFTSGDESEIRVLEPVQMILSQAVLFVHTHPSSAANLQSGPTAQDLQAASDQLEYVITGRGFFAYDRTGIKNSNASLALLAQLIAGTDGHWKDSTPQAERTVRETLHDLILAMDRQRAMKLAEAGEQTERETKQLRAGEREDSAMLFAKQDLSGRVGTALEDISEVDISNPEADRFILHLQAEQTVYEYLVDLALAEDQAGLRGYVTTATEPDEVSGQPSVNRYSYNGDSRPLKIEYGLSGKVKTYSYDDLLNEYTVTSGTTSQVWGYGLDLKTMTVDDKL